MEEEPGTPSRAVGDKLRRDQGAGMSSGGSPDDDAKKQKGGDGEEATEGEAANPPEARPAARLTAETAANLEARPAAGLEARPAADLASRSAAIPEARQVANPEARQVANPEARLVVMPEDEHKRARTGSAEDVERAEERAHERRLSKDIELARIRRLRDAVPVNLTTMHDKLNTIVPLVGSKELTADEKEARLAILDLLEAGREVAESILSVLVEQIYDLIRPKPNAQQPEAAVGAGGPSTSPSTASEADDAPAVVELRGGVRVRGAAGIPGMPVGAAELRKRLEAHAKKYLEKKLVRLEALLKRSGDGKRLDAPVSAGEYSSLEEKALAFIARAFKELSPDDEEYSISSLKARVADCGGALPDPLRLLLLSGAFGPLVLAVAKGLLAKRLLESRYGGVRNSRVSVEEEYLWAYEACRVAVDGGNDRAANDFAFLRLFKNEFEKEEQTGKAAPPDTREEAYLAAAEEGRMCARHIRAMFRDSMAEIEMPPPFIQILTTPGLTWARVDGELVLTLPPKVVVSDDDEKPVLFRDNLATGKKTGIRGDLVPQSAFTMKKKKGEDGIPRNASSMTGGQGSSARGRSVHAEMRRPVDEGVPPQVVAEVQTHFVSSDELALDLCYEFPGYARAAGGKGPNATKPSDVSMGKLRLILTSSGANIVGRLFGPDGILGVGVIPVEFRGDGVELGHGWGTDAGLIELAEKVGFFEIDPHLNRDGSRLGDLLATYTLFHTWTHADYAALRADPTRRIFPCITEISEEVFRRRALRGWALVASAAGIDDRKRDFIEGSAAMAMAKSMRPFFMRVMDAMWPFGETKTQLMGQRKIMGNFLVSRHVRDDFARYVMLAIAGAAPSLELFDEATKELVPLVLEGVVTIVGLVVSLDNRMPTPFEVNAHLKSKEVERSDVELKHVSFLNVLRVSQKKTLIDSNRYGFRSQLVLFQQTAQRDGEDWSQGLFAARYLSRTDPEALDDDGLQFVLAAELDRCVPHVPAPGQPRLATTPFAKAPEAAIRHRAENEKRDPTDRDVVVLRVAYSTRLSLKMLLEGKKNRVIGVDAFDLRKLLEALPVLRLAEEGPLSTVFDVRDGTAGFAVLSMILNFGEAAVTDLNILRLFGILAAAKEKKEVADEAKRRRNDEAKRRRLDSVAKNVAHSVTQYEKTVYPAFRPFFFLPESSGSTTRRESAQPVGASIFAQRLSTDRQTFKAQNMAMELAGFGVNAERVQLQPFGARQSLFGEEKKQKVLAACAWASTSRLAIRDVLENARDENLCLSSVDFAIAAKLGKIDERWIRDDARGVVNNAFSASLNVQDAYVFKFFDALRAVGHHFDRVLKSVLTARGVHFGARSSSLDDEELDDEDLDEYFD